VKHCRSERKSRRHWQFSSGERDKRPERERGQQRSPIKDWKKTSGAWGGGKKNKGPRLDRRQGGGRVLTSF